MTCHAFVNLAQVEYDALRRRFHLLAGSHDPLLTRRSLEAFAEFPETKFHGPSFETIEDEAFAALAHRALDEAIASMTLREKRSYF